MLGIFSNYKEETFLILEDSLGEHEYKLLSKAYEQNIVTGQSTKWMKKRYSL